jgi:hypothetical protein
VFVSDQADDGDLATQLHPTMTACAQRIASTNLGAGLERLRRLAKRVCATKSARNEGRASRQTGTAKGKFAWKKTGQPLLPRGGHTVTTRRGHVTRLHGAVALAPCFANDAPRNKRIYCHSAGKITRARAANKSGQV